MAFTKITAAGIGSTETVTLDGLSVINNGSIGGNLTVGGVLTYEDVTNVDSVGLITARAGIVVGSGITLSKDGDGFFTGIVTASSFVGSGAELTGVASTENIRTNTNATFLQNVTVVGTSTVTGNIVPNSDSATDIGTNSVRFQNAYVDTYYGDGSNLTGISAGVSLANGADNRVVTATGAAALNGESGVTYDGTDFTVSSGRVTISDESSGAQFRIGAGDDFQIEHDGSNTYIYNLTNDLVIQNDANVKITAKSGGTQRFRFDSDGLKFGTDTATDNALDDYEEGTWTPVIQGTGSNNSKNYVTQTAHYTKVGRLVTVSYRIAWNNKSADSGSAVISGLPFTINETTASGGAFTGNNLDFPSNVVVATTETANNQTFVYILVGFDSGTWDNPSAGFFQSSGNIRGQFHYITNS